MAKRKLYETTDISASGYIMNVSPMKSSQRGFQFFNAELQEQDKTTHIVGYNDKKRRELKTMADQRTAITLSAVTRLPSQKTPGDFDIKLTNQTAISPAKLNYAFEAASHSTPKSTEVSIIEIEDLPIQTKVTVTAKVVKKLETVQQELYNRKMMDRTTFVIADKTSAILLTLWGPENQILEDNTYKFENLSIKVFDGTKVNTNPYTSITKVSNMDNIASSDHLLKSKDKKTQEGQIVTAKIDHDKKCFHCNTAITVNEDILTVKCENCQRRQLVASVKTVVTCEITFSSENTTQVLAIPANVLNTYTNTENSADDKELFLLSHGHVQITFVNDIVMDITEMNN